MAVLVLASPGGAPGVTTTALALTLAWPRAVVMAECDPAGGSVLAGLWQGRVPAGAAGALLRFAVAAQHDPAAAAAALAPLLARAECLLMVCRPTAPQAAAAKPRLAALAHIRAADGLVLVGSGAYGGSAAKVFARDLGVPVAGAIPDDGAAASIL